DLGELALLLEELEQERLFGCSFDHRRAPAPPVTDVLLPAGRGAGDAGRGGGEDARGVGEDVLEPVAELAGLDAVADAGGLPPCFAETSGSSSLSVMSCPLPSMTAKFSPTCRARRSGPSGIRVMSPSR